MCQIIRKLPGILCLRPAPPLRGETDVPGDKSITHRALLLGALGDGVSRIYGYLDSGDCRATMGCLRAMGVEISWQEAVEGDQNPIPTLVVQGVGLRGLREPEAPLDCVRSGTTMRLLTGLLAGQPFYTVLTGEAQLRRRPMDRITIPLRQMGARIWGRQGGRFPPLSIQGGQLVSIDYALPVASAQVKSCLLLAGLYAQGSTRLVEPGPSRDHTERMLCARGVAIESQGLEHRVQGPVERLAALDTTVPGDLSSAAYLLVAALLVPGSEVCLRHVGINPTRTGLLDVLAQMGARIELQNQHDEGGEPVADLVVRTQELAATEIGGELVPRMIDEFPILALAATQARGTTRVRDAAELRVKESDRIATIVEALGALGARIDPRDDGFDVHGPTPLRGARVSSHGDHRLAMTLAIAGLIAQGETLIEDADCIADSFPGFEERLHKIVGEK
ncbi:MAG: 3-phosphoshikimate 1-carboxyvinyltransferase [Chloroflexi bacterium]|nr:3-phosphoshikimate 1-carboxyvinyltransferase [Chloroflexota bacterium]